MDQRNSGILLTLHQNILLRTMRSGKLHYSLILHLGQTDFEIDFCPGAMSINSESSMYYLESNLTILDVTQETVIPYKLAVLCSLLYKQTQQQ